MVTGVWGKDVSAGRCCCRRYNRTEPPLRGASNEAARERRSPPFSLPLVGRGAAVAREAGGGGRVGVARRIAGIDAAATPPDPTPTPPHKGEGNAMRQANSKIVLAARLRARALPTTTPRKDSPPAQKEGGEAPTGALSYQSPLARRRIHRWTRPPIGASPRHSPLATTPMAQPQNRVSRGLKLAGVLPACLCPRLSTLRADRSFCRSTGAPEPPGSGSHASARGDRTSLTSSESALAKGAPR